MKNRVSKKNKVVTGSVIFALLLGITGNAANNNKFTVDYKQCGYAHYCRDLESELYYLKARYYSPELMRFISRDTYDLSNRYTYCDANPIRKVDPSGHNGLDFAIMALDIASLIPPFTAGFIATKSAKIAMVTSNWYKAAMATNSVGLVTSGYVVCEEATKNSKDNSWSDFSWDDSNNNKIFSIVGLAFNCFSIFSFQKANKAQKLANVELKSTLKQELELERVATTESIAKVIFKDMQRDLAIMSSGGESGILLPITSLQEMGNNTFRMRGLELQIVIENKNCIITSCKVVKTDIHTLKEESYCNRLCKLLTEEYGPKK